MANLNNILEALIGQVFIEKKQFQRPVPPLRGYRFDNNRAIKILSFTLTLASPRMLGILRSFSTNPQRNDLFFNPHFRGVLAVEHHYHSAYE